MDQPDGAHATRLRVAPLELVGRFADASNATLLVRLRDADARTLPEIARGLGRDPTIADLPPEDLAVYKPVDGEQPLWDFPSRTLHLREVAAFATSAALGWGLVPLTVLRDDAPLGAGSLQRFVPHDLEEHYFHLLRHGEAGVLDQLRAMVVFDVLINNADRKGGHVLLEATPDGARVRLIDHGVTFHAQPKLRTVGWHFAGEPVPVALRDDLAGLPAALDGTLGATLAGLLLPAELAALRARAAGLVRVERLPAPHGPRSTPWPLL